MSASYRFSAPLAWLIFLFASLSVLLLISSVALAGVPTDSIPRAGSDSAKLASSPGSPQSLLTGLTSSNAGPASRPASPGAIIWDQYNHMGRSASTSQNFEPRFDTFDNQTADNFYIGPFQTWVVDGIEVAGAYSTASVADSVNVYFYIGNSGAPDTPVFTDTNLPYVPGPQLGDMVIQLSQPITLTAEGYYWVSVQANMNLQDGGQWFWRNNPLGFGVYSATWRNPGDGFDRCSGWTRRGLCGISGNEADQSFLLTGTTMGTPPTATGTPPTATETTISTETPTSTEVPTETPSPTGTLETPTETIFVPDPVLTQQVPVTPSATQTASNTPTSTATFTPIPACGQNWRVSNSANMGDTSVFYDIAALSAYDIWAVGTRRDSGSPLSTLIEHWNGSTWQIIPSPNLSSSDNVLLSVDIVGPNDVWAVGYSLPTNTLAMHWDGAVWSIVSSPSPGTENTLRGVSAVSSDYIWAVGSSDNESLILKWNGVEWSRTVSPNRPNGANYLADISAVSPNLAWATGYSGSADAILMSWNGSEWSYVPGMDIFPVRFFSVAAYSATDAWVVGSTIAVGGSLRPTILHWDGSNWFGVSVPNFGDGYHEAYGVAAISPNEAWVVGGLNQAYGLIMHCVVGVGCSQSPSPYPGSDYSPLRSVAVVSSNIAWAVGEWNNGIAHTLADLYNDPCGTPPPTSTPLIPTATSTGTPTNTPANTSTSTPSATSTNTSTPSATLTSTSTRTPIATSTPTSCPLQFEDVPSGSTFYSFVRCMVCQGIINGYPCGSLEPCVPPNNYPYFRPNNNITRGQISKIVANAAGFQEPVSSQTFEDVLPGSTFHLFIERLASRAVISGYACGGSGEPCIAPSNRPYFRPNGNTTRGQLSKIVCRAYGCTGAVAGQTFEDVTAGHTFYQDIEHLYALGAISGYACGGPGEPCIAPSNRPYFRPGANVTRGQTAKIVSNVFSPGCNPPRLR